MAQGTSEGEEVTDRFEPIVVESKNPTIVLSVRLEEATAKELHRWARQRGVRVSDVLREAAVHYAKVGPHQTDLSYRVTWGSVNVGLGVTAFATEATREARDVSTDQDPPPPRQTVPTLTGR